MTNTNTAPKAPITKKSTPAKKATAAAPQATAPKAKPELPYDFELYRDLKLRGTEALHAVLYDARLKTPKGSKSPEEAAAKAQALISAFREWVRLAEESARPLEKAGK